MKCNYCDAEISYKLIRCPYCGNNQQIVPDYNPLDDLLSDQIKIDQDTGTLKKPEESNPTTVVSPKKPVTVTKPKTSVSKAATKSSKTRTTQRPSNGKRPMTEREKQRRKKQRMRELRRRRRRLVLSMLLVLILICSLAGICFYQFSYGGIVKQGYRAISASDYELAKSKFEKAISKNANRSEAYKGLSDVYLALNQKDTAEKVFTDLIDEDKANVKIYETLIKFYMETEQKAKIPGILAKVDDSTLKQLSSYVVNEPIYSLDASTDYDEVQLLAITCDEGCKIYYTTNGRTPTEKSTEYTEAILLEEGITTINAIAVDDRGIPSQTATEAYKIELPIEDAPAVSPSTGQYTVAQEIEIKVPDGYTAYYTLDGSEPTSASALYYDPIEMPEGETIFKAILVSNSGKLSGVTTRNYVLEE